MMKYSERKWEVMFIDESNRQKRYATYRDFWDAQDHRDQLRAQGYDAWLEDAAPEGSKTGTPA